MLISGSLQPFAKYYYIVWTRRGFPSLWTRSLFYQRRRQPNFYCARGWASIWPRDSARVGLPVWLALCALPNLGPGWWSSDEGKRPPLCAARLFSVVAKTPAAVVCDFVTVISIPMHMRFNVNGQKLLNPDFDRGHSLAFSER